VQEPEQLPSQEAVQSALAGTTLHSVSQVAEQLASQVEAHWESLHWAWQSPAQSAVQ
jgi:hypothetical protein